MLYRLLQFLIWLYNHTKGYKTIVVSLACLIYGFHVNDYNLVAIGLVGLGLRDAVHTQTVTTAKQTMVLVAQLLDAIQKATPTE